MSIQRWSISVGGMSYSFAPSAEGRYVAYTDHVAAVAEAEERVRMDGINAVVAAQANSYQQGVAAAREAVAAAPAYYCEDQWSGADTHRLLSEALAAIDNLKEDK